MVTLLGKRWNTIIGRHKQVRQVLRHLGLVTEQVDDGIVVVDLKGNLHFVNTAWARMHGRKSSRELLGSHIGEFYPPQQLKQNLTRLMDEARRRGSFADEVEHIRSDGTAFAARTKVTVLKDDRDNPSGFLIVAADLTEPKSRTNLPGPPPSSARGEPPICSVAEPLRELVRQLEAANEKLRGQMAERTHLEQVLANTVEQSRQLGQQIEQLRREMTEKALAENQLTQHAKADDSKKPDAYKPRRGETQEQEDQEEGDSEQPCVQLDTERLRAVADIAKRLR